MWFSLIFLTVTIAFSESDFIARNWAGDIDLSSVYQNEYSPSIDRNKVWHIRKKLDLKLMKKAAKMLLGKKDFKTFQASNCYSPTSVKTLKKLEQYYEEIVEIRGAGLLLGIKTKKNNSIINK